MSAMRGSWELELGEGHETREGISSFCYLPPTMAKDFDAIRSTTTYPEGAILFGEKQPARGVFVLCQGEVKLSISSTEGRTLGIRVAKTGELLGLVSAVAGTAYEMTAETLCLSQLEFVPREDFLRFLAKWPHAVQAVARQMKAELRFVLMAKTVA